MLKRLGIFIGIAAGVVGYVILNIWIVEICSKRAGEHWGWGMVVLFAVLITPFAVEMALLAAVILLFLPVAGILWIITGEWAEDWPTIWEIMVSHLHREPKASYLYIENITDSEKDLRDATEELDREYPGTGG